MSVSVTILIVMATKLVQQAKYKNLILLVYILPTN